MPSLVLLILFIPCVLTIEVNDSKTFESLNEIPPCNISDWTDKPAKLAKIVDPKLRELSYSLNRIWPNLCQEINHTLSSDNKHYFMFKGLLASGMHETAKNMLANFVFLRPNYSENSHSPVLISMFYDYLQATRDIKFVHDNILALEKEFNSYDRKIVQIGNSTLKMFHYTDAIKPQQNFDLSVELNSFMCRNLEIMALFYSQMPGGYSKEMQYHREHIQFKRDFETVFYVEEDGWYDYNFKGNNHIIAYNISNLIPIFTECYDTLDQIKVAKVLNRFIKNGAFDLTSKNQAIDDSNLSLQFFIIDGMRRSYSPEVQALAYRLAERLINSSYNLKNVVLIDILVKYGNRLNWTEITKEALSDQKDLNIPHLYQSYSPSTVDASILVLFVSFFTVKIVV